MLKCIPRSLLFLLLPFAFVNAYGQEIPSNKTPKVIIIGAGISGLTAAHFLSKKNIPVLVLEARNRIGGRIFSIHPWGAGIDLGASWIHGVKNNPIAQLVNEQHIKTMPTTYASQEVEKKLNDFVFYDANGKKVPKERIKKLFSLFVEYREYVEDHAQEFNKKSAADTLRLFSIKKQLSKETLNELQFILINIYTYEYAADLQQLPANVESVFEDSEISGQNVIFLHGYIQVIAQLAKNVPIKLNQQVIKIKYDENGVDVFTQNQHYHGDYVLVTVPLGVLKAGSIQFSPALPKEKMQAIQNLKMGIFDKIYLFFDHPFWDKNSEWIGYIPKVDEISHSIDIMNYYKFTHLPILLVFSAGDLAARMESQTDTQIITSIMTTLKKVYGNDIPEPTSYFITRWNSDPYAKGSYSYLPVHANLSNYETLARPILNKIFFAGEATTTSDSATVHGAYLTGKRAAKEIIDLESS